MIVIPGNKIAYFDVDDTCVYWSSTAEDKEKYGVRFTCPGSMVWDVDGSEIGYAGEWSEVLVPNLAIIEQMIKLKLRNHTIVLWSAGGYDWAHAVANTLKLESYIDVVMCKPT
jgi:hypothetical protein